MLYRVTIHIAICSGERLPQACIACGYFIVRAPCYSKAPDFFTPSGKYLVLILLVVQNFSLRLGVRYWIPLRYLPYRPRFVLAPRA